jgi:site-specific DNA recombinase
MATFIQIQTLVKQNYGFVPATCWIADVESQSGLPMRKAPNRRGAGRVKPCPPEKVESIRAALRYFGMIRKI